MLTFDEVGWIKETMRYSNYANYQKSPTPKECHIQSWWCLGQAFSMQMGGMALIMNILSVQLDCHDDVTYKDECLSLFPLGITLGTTQTFPCLAQLVVFQSHDLF